MISLDHSRKWRVSPKLLELFDQFYYSERDSRARRKKTRYILYKKNLKILYKNIGTQDAVQWKGHNKKLLAFREKEKKVAWNFGSRFITVEDVYEWTSPVGECWPQTTLHTKCLLSMYDLRPTSHKFRITRGRFSKISKNYSLWRRGFYYFQRVQCVARSVEPLNLNHRSW